MAKFNFQLTKQFFAAIFLMCSWISITAQVNNVGIGTTTPDPSAILELQATDQGFLPPRMDQSGENALPSPAQGLMIYNTNVNNGGTSGLRYYNGMLWASVLNQQSSGEIFLDNLTSNYFNIPTNSNYSFQIDGTPLYQISESMHDFNIDNNLMYQINGTGHTFNIGGNQHYEMTATEHNFQIDGNPILKLNSSANNNHILIDDHSINSFDDAGNLTNMYINDNIYVKANGNTRFRKPGTDTNIWIWGGNNISARNDADNANKSLVLNGMLTLKDDGNMNYHKPGSDRNLVFINGNQIVCEGNNGDDHDLYLQSNNGDGDVRIQNHLRVDNMDVWNGNDDYDMTWGSDRWLTIEGSSRRFKKDIRDAEFNFRDILKLKIREYHMKEKYGSAELKLGVIAEEADELGLDYLVRHDNEGVIDGFYYKKMGLYLLPVIQDQDQVIKKQQQKIDDLETRLERLEALLTKKD